MRIDRQLWLRHLALLAVLAGSLFNWHTCGSLSSAPAGGLSVGRSRRVNMNGQVSRQDQEGESLAGLATAM
jgi:hypothetical protein